MFVNAFVDPARPNPARTPPVAHQDLDAIQAVNPEAELMDPGWTLYNPVNEYQRMGVGLRATQWRISTVNLDYSLCDTYPSVLAVPSACSDEKLLAAAKFRSRGRIPILSYLHPDNMVGCAAPRPLLVPNPCPC